MKDKYGTARPYAASYVLLRRGDEVALLLRGNLPWMGHHYGLPAGKVETNESFAEAAIREAEEEIGVKFKPAQLEHVLSVYRYSVEDDGSSMEWADTIFEAREWDSEPFNAEPHMHDSLEWFSLTKLPENTIPAIRAYLKAIEDGQHYIEYGWDQR